MITFSEGVLKMLYFMRILNFFLFNSVSRSIRLQNIISSRDGLHDKRLKSGYYFTDKYYTGYVTPKCLAKSLAKSDQIFISAFTELMQ